MKLKPSPLRLKDFVVLRYDYKFIAIVNDISFPEYFSNYDYDLDFAIRQNPDNTINIFVKILINNPSAGKPLQGYSMEVEGVGIFSLDENAIQKTDKDTLLVNSGLSMTINYLRNFIAGATSHFPAGRLWVPSLDLRDLVAGKKAAMQNEPVAPGKNVKHKRNTKK
ncbi:MAG TPA: hypothetical protein VFS25_12920 [Chitinophaga sp.]|uniref:hypothetical protein n=1 Tax=Chitinophaga sp. TaxID=1869181 RepID=UPI002DBA18FA|nr:hypothetical protein [Chitinophaga sp.]HEU4553736.1 hypothetical protein [Chitinophaga sp.]